MQSKKLSIRSLVASVLATSGAWALPAVSVAQQPGGTPATGTESSIIGLEEIVVSARKRDEKLLDVPVAITAIGGAELARTGATDLTKIGQMLPQVRFEKVGGGGSGATFAIRGIGSASGDKGIEQTVAVNIDGVQSSRGKLSILSMFDVQQIEVLKGPQALYFGKNSPGGVVAVKTVNPGDKFEGYARAGYEFKARERFVEAAAGGPLSDTFGARLALRASKMDGWLKNDAVAGANPFDPAAPTNPGHDRIPGSKEVLGRLTLAWKPSDRFDANFKLFAADVKENNEFGAGETLCSSAYTNPTSAGRADPNGDCRLDGHTSWGGLPKAYAGAGWPGSRDGDPYQDTKALFSSLKLNYGLENFTITSLTGAYRFNSKGFDNYDGTVYARLTGYTHEKTQQFSQELRVGSTFDGPFNASIGGYFESQKRNSGGIGGAGVNTPDARNGQYNLWTREETGHGKTYSVFGEIDYRILPELVLTGGARWTKENKRLRTANLFVNQSQMLAPTLPARVIMLAEGRVLRPHRSDDNVSPEVSLTWKPQEHLMAYVAYRSGYKSGGLSSTSVLGASANETNLQFEPEKAKGGEVGMKGEFLDRRLMIAATVYRYKFSNLQQTSFDPGPPPGFLLKNVGGARTTGFEISSQLRATSDLTLNGTLAYNDGKYTSFPGASCYTGQTLAQGCTRSGTDQGQDLTGHQLPYNPKWSGVIGFSYDTAVTDALKVGLDGSASYSGAYWANTTENPLARQDDFWRINAVVRVHDADDRWEIALVGRNLTNERYGVYLTDKPGGPSTGGQILAATGRTRELGVQGTVRF
ncbi:MAG: TonB-dependent receptor [Steroidobacteraceae bacterium]